jgi:hypothetical protein
VRDTFYALENLVLLLRICVPLRNVCTVTAGGR